MGGLTFKIGELAAIRKALDRPFCKKRSFRSQGAAEAQLRSLLRYASGNEAGARKTGDTSRLNVYVCRTCTANTGEEVWHTGHVKLGGEPGAEGR